MPQDTPLGRVDGLPSVLLCQGFYWGHEQALESRVLERSLAVVILIIYCILHLSKFELFVKD